MADITAVRTQSPSAQAYQMLYLTYIVIPLAAGIDKFFHFLVNWDQYLSPTIAQLAPVSAHTFMLGVGVVEMIAGVLVAVAPRIGGWVVAAWLFGIIVNLLLIPGYLDIAVRDFGLAMGAIAMAMLAQDHA